MNQLHFKPLTMGLLTASVLTLAGLGLFASRTQAADAPKAAAAAKAALTVSTVQAKSSQLPVKLWHGQFQDPTLADAILDRLVHNAELIELTGESMRKKAHRAAASGDKSDPAS